MKQNKPSFSKKPAPNKFAAAAPTGSFPKKPFPAKPAPTITPAVSLPSSVIQEANLMRAWEQLVATVPFDVLKKNIKTLWTRFNKDRDDLPRDYMTQDTTAYIASFFLPNLAKIELLIRQKAFQAAFTQAYKNWGSEWTVVDFGSGPLTASIAFLKSLNFKKGEKAPNKITIVAVEPSSISVKVGEALLRQAVSKDIEIAVAHARSMEGSYTAHVILAANSLNEIPNKLRTKTLNRFLQILHESGLMLIVEPGQDVHSKALSALRDGMLGDMKKQKRAILAPCFHHNACPLGPQSKRSDWCWFQQVWHVPQAQHQIDLKTGIDHRELNYSYLLVGAEAHRQQRYARVVSDSFQVPVSKSTLMYWQHNVLDANPQSLVKLSRLQRAAKQLLCTQDGVLTAQLAVQPFPTKRGDAVDATQVSLEVKERTAVQ